MTAALAEPWISSAAGAGFGPFVADYLGGGTLGSAASAPDCRP
ncbi:MAG TPA: hypothetical protein VFO65_13375 [Acidimicrobiales bacterium]|nr:hypothetical protein [Acidimicrobiales bacterium]